jgi:hypothetical protein
MAVRITPPWGWQYAECGTGWNAHRHHLIWRRCIADGERHQQRTTAFQHGNAAISGSVSGEGQLLKDGDGTLTVSNGTLSQSQVNLNQGTLALNNAIINSDIIAQSGTQVRLTGNSVLNGAIDPTDVTLDSGASWNIQRGAAVKSVLDNLDNAGTISFAPAPAVRLSLKP